MRFIRLMRDQRGMALATVFIMMLFSGILILAVLRISSGNFSITKGTEHSQQAYFLAHAGLEYASYLIDPSGANLTNPESTATWPDLDNNGIGGDIPSIAFGTITSLTIAFSNPNYTVVSVGEVAGHQRTVNATVSPSGTLLSWN